MVGKMRAEINVNYIPRLFGKKVGLDSETAAAAYKDFIIRHDRDRDWQGTTIKTIEALRGKIDSDVLLRLIIGWKQGDERACRLLA